MGGGNVASSYDDLIPFTPAWQKTLLVYREKKVIQGIAREFADNANKTKGRPRLCGRGDEPLVPHGYELPWLDQHVDHVVALVKPAVAGHYVGQENSVANWLDATGLCLGLASTTTSYELHVFLL